MGIPIPGLSLMLKCSHLTTSIHLPSTLTMSPRRGACCGLYTRIFLLIRVFLEGVDLIRGPVGIDTVAAALSEESDTIMDVYEPYLLQLGFLGRTPRGRIATRRAYEHLGTPYENEPEQPNLL